MTLEWFLCFISGLPEIQAKCQAEIDETIGIFYNLRRGFLLKFAVTPIKYIQNLEIDKTIINTLSISN